jgi:hypothetical protein
VLLNPVAVFVPNDTDDGGGAWNGVAVTTAGLLVLLLLLFGLVAVPACR